MYSLASPAGISDMSLSRCKSEIALNVPSERGGWALQAHTLCSVCCLTSNSLFVAPMKSSQVEMNGDVPNSPLKAEG